MRSLRAYEIVASIVRWPNDHVVCGQHLERFFEHRTRQVWAVAVESNGASVMVLREVRKHGSEARRKTFTFLGNYADFVARQLPQFVYVRVGAHDGNFDIAQ